MAIINVDKPVEVRSRQSILAALCFSEEQADTEIARIVEFIRTQVGSYSNVVLGVSGGVDSDVAARLCTKAVGNERLVCFIALNDGLEEHHKQDAASLCNDLNLPLIQFSVGDLPAAILSAMVKGDGRFIADSAGDLMRVTLSIRTVLLSMYNEHGFFVISASNRTELETGLFMSFGDALGHIRPLMHLYKTQVYQLAERLGTNAAVLRKPASSGLRIGARDLADLAHWFSKGQPDVGNPHYSEASERRANDILAELTFEKLDRVLLGLRIGETPGAISEASGATEHLVKTISDYVQKVPSTKGRRIGVHLPL